jgi:hypothetical protein
MTFHSGFNGKATINGNEVPITLWSVNPGVRVAATDNSMSGGFMLREASGGKTASYTITLDHDFDANPFATPYGLVIGSKITNVKLFLNGTAGLFWNFPSSVVTSTPQQAQHSGTDMIGVTVNCDSDGSFDLPGAITP